MLTDELADKSEEKGIFGDVCLYAHGHCANKIVDIEQTETKDEGPEEEADKPIVSNDGEQQNKDDASQNPEMSEDTSTFFTSGIDE